MTRRYEQTKRAEQQNETRQRITRAAVELHESLGPARTSISAIAERAGVQRLTVYRHFPDERALFAACTSHYLAENPPPDPALWRVVKDPEERLRAALGEVYAYYGRTEAMMANSIRDASLKPVMVEALGSFYERWAEMREVLAAGWGARGRRRERLLAAIGHALDFEAWRSLARREGLDEASTVEFMICAVRCAAGRD